MFPIITEFNKKKKSVFILQENRTLFEMYKLLSHAF